MRVPIVLPGAEWTTRCKSLAAHMLQEHGHELHNIFMQHTSQPHLASSPEYNGYAMIYQKLMVRALPWLLW